MRAALEILTLILRAIERYVSAAKQKQKQHAVDEANEDPEQFFDTHFNGYGDRLHGDEADDAGGSSEANSANRQE